MRQSLNGIAFHGGAGGAMKRDGNETGRFGKVGDAQEFPKIDREHFSVPARITDSDSILQAFNRTDIEEGGATV